MTFLVKLLTQVHYQLIKFNHSYLHQIRYTKVAVRVCSIVLDFSRKLGFLTKSNSYVKNGKALGFLEKQSGVGKIIATFYNICNETWSKSPVNEARKSGIEKNLARKKE